MKKARQIKKCIEKCIENYVLEEKSPDDNDRFLQTSED